MISHCPYKVIHTEWSENGYSWYTVCVCYSATVPGTCYENKRPTRCWPLDTRLCFTKTYWKTASIYLDLHVKHISECHGNEKYARNIGVLSGKANKKCCAVATYADQEQDRINIAMNFETNVISRINLCFFWVWWPVARQIFLVSRWVPHCQSGLYEMWYWSNKRV